MNHGFEARAAISLILLAAGLAVADEFEIDWWTTDGGGDMWTTGGGFELSGTVGQPDAGATMTGGDFELTGGFWVVVLPIPPTVCPGDCNCDGSVGFADIDLFVAGIPNNQTAWAAKYQLFYGSPPPEGCWENCDVNGAGTHCGFDDIDPFVKLIPTPCTTRACCFPDHSCQDLIPGNCLIAGGTFFAGPSGNQPCSATTCP